MKNLLKQLLGLKDDKRLRSFTNIALTYKDNVGEYRSVIEIDGQPFASHKYSSREEADKDLIQFLKSLGYTGRISTTPYDGIMEYVIE